MIDWIQDTIGAKRVREPSCNAPPVATAEPLVTHKGYTRSTTVVVTDEDGDAGQATLAIVVGPAHGKAAVALQDLRPGSLHAGWHGRCSRPGDREHRADQRRVTLSSTIRTRWAPRSW
jgi:hypothetical protein